MIFRNEGLTAIQVEALQECFDFIRNGYMEVLSYSSEDFWFVKLRHKRNRKVLKVYVYPTYYYIDRARKIVKWVENNDDVQRYNIVVNSDLYIKKWKVCLGECKNLISGSDLPNSNEA